QGRPRLARAVYGHPRRDQLPHRRRACPLRGARQHLPPHPCARRPPRAPRPPPRRHQGRSRRDARPRPPHSQPLQPTPPCAGGHRPEQGVHEQGARAVQRHLNSHAPHPRQALEPVRAQRSAHRQTQAALAAFRHARAKLLMTVTITRNAIRESYSQLALLYNASTLFTSDARVIYEQNKEGDLEPKNNPLWGEPYVHRAGLKNFTAAYNPTRTTVFGIQKQVQDVHNLETLADLIKRTVIRRSFNEVVGPNKYTIHQHTLPFTQPERALHEKLIKELHEFLTDFEDTGNSRKEAGLRGVRQLRLLIESCLHPHLFKEWSRHVTAN